MSYLRKMARHAPEARRIETLKLHSETLPQKILPYTLGHKSEGV
jgi:hypothetical protein